MPIKGIAQMISNKYKIKSQIIIKYIKDKRLVAIDPNMSIKDIREELIQTKKRILFVDIKKQETLTISKTSYAFEKYINISSINMEKYLLDINDYEIKQSIANGSFSTVYSVINTKTNEIFAAKRFIRKHDYENIIADREIKIMMQINHHSIVKFHGYSLTDLEGENNVTIFMELVIGESLESVLDKAQKGLANIKYDNTSRQIILIGIAHAMMYLHKKGNHSS